MKRGALTEAASMTIDSSPHAAGLADKKKSGQCGRADGCAGMRDRQRSDQQGRVAVAEIRG
jgi:hypothetical protein